MANEAHQKDAITNKNNANISKRCEAEIKSKDETDSSPKVSLTRQEKRRRARKIISKSRKGIGLVCFHELEELQSIQEFLKNEAETKKECENMRKDKITSTIDKETLSLFEIPLPYFTLSSQNIKKNKKKRKHIESQSLQNNQIIKSNHSSEKIVDNSSSPPISKLQSLSIRSQWQQSTGSDIRHIIQRLLLFANGPPSPSWCAIRNPVCCKNIAVVEFSSSSSKFSLSSMLSYLHKKNQIKSTIETPSRQTNDVEPKQSTTLLDLLTTGLGAKQKRIGLPLKTSLFEGDATKTITQALMYAPFKPLQSKKKKEKSKKDVQKNHAKTMKDKLFELALTDDERRINGYYFAPSATSHNVSDPESMESKNTSLFESKRRAARRKIMMEYLNPADDIKLQNSKNKKNFMLPLFEKSKAIIDDIQVPATIFKKNDDILFNHSIDNVDVTSDDESEPANYFVESFQPQTIACCTSESSRRNIYGLDCEMVKTEFGAELARVTLVRADSICNSKPEPETSFVTILDEFVKPYNPVLDYLEEYSGINAKILNPVTTRLEQIQLALLLILKPTDLLIGHSLENDLKVLKFIHPCVLDTAVLFSSYGRKHSLRHLASVLLKKDIQQNVLNETNEKQGHCSEEDAITAMELAIRRAIDGDSFRLIQEDNKRKRSNIMHRMEELMKQHQQMPQNQTNQHSKNDQKHKKNKQDKKNNRDCPLYKHNGSFVCIGPSDWIKSNHNSYKSSAHVLSSESIKDDLGWKAIPAFLKSNRKAASFLWAHLRIPEDEYEIRDKKKKNRNGDGDGDGDGVMEERIQDIEKVINHVVIGSPPTCLILFLFQGGLSKAYEMEKLKKAMSNPKSTLPWTDSEEQALKTAVDRCRHIDTILVGSPSS